MLSNQRHLAMMERLHAHFIRELIVHMFHKFAQPNEIRKGYCEWIVPLLLSSKTCFEIMRSVIADEVLIVFKVNSFVWAQVPPYYSMNSYLIGKSEQFETIKVLLKWTTKLDASYQILEDPGKTAVELRKNKNIARLSVVNFNNRSQLDQMAQTWPNVKHLLVNYKYDGYVFEPLSLWPKLEMLSCTVLNNSEWNIVFLRDMPPKLELKMPEMLGVRKPYATFKEVKALVINTEVSLIDVVDKLPRFLKSFPSLEKLECNMELRYPQSWDLLKIDKTRRAFFGLTLKCTVFMKLTQRSHTLDLDDLRCRGKNLEKLGFEICSSNGQHNIIYSIRLMSQNKVLTHVIELFTFRD